MEKVTVNKSSWHYRLNTWILREDNMLPDEIDNYMKYNSNFCAYWRMTIWNVCKISFWTAVLVAILGAICIGVYKLAMFFFTQPSTEILTVLTSIALLLGIVGLVGLVALFFGSIEKSKRKRREIARGDYVEPQPGLLKTKYKTWKQKICPMIEYK